MTTKSKKVVEMPNAGTALTGREAAEMEESKELTPLEVIHIGDHLTMNPLDIEADWAVNGRVAVPAKITELAKQFKRPFGQLQAAGVYWDETKQTYVLAYGFHRHAAAIEAGVPLLVRVVDSTPGIETLLLNWNENNTRANLDPVSELGYMLRLRDEHGLTGKDIAKKLGVSPALVSMRLQLAVLPAQVLQMVQQGVITVKGAYALAAESDAARRQMLLENLIPMSEFKPVDIEKFKINPVNQSAVAAAARNLDAPPAPPVDPNAPPVPEPPPAPAPETDAPRKTKDLIALIEAERNTKDVDSKSKWNTVWNAWGRWQAGIMSTKTLRKVIAREMGLAEPPEYAAPEVVQTPAQKKAAAVAAKKAAVKAAAAAKKEAKKAEIAAVKAAVKEATAKAKAELKAATAAAKAAGAPAALPTGPVPVPAAQPAPQPAA